MRRGKISRSCCTPPSLVYVVRMVALEIAGRNLFVVDGPGGLVANWDLQLGHCKDKATVVDSSNKHCLSSESEVMLTLAKTRRDERDPAEAARLTGMYKRLFSSLLNCLGILGDVGITHQWK